MILKSQWWPIDVTSDGIGWHWKWRIVIDVWNISINEINSINEILIVNNGSDDHIENVGMMKANQSKWYWRKLLVMAIIDIDIIIENNDQQCNHNAKWY